jgi:UDP:flavonoid glycosyltransferase YjiC (YdhE family)
MLCPDPTVDELVDLARRWRPDLVVWNTMAMAGPVVARACGAAHVRMLFGTDGLAQLRAANRSTDDPVRAWLEPRMARHGCDFAEEDVLGDWTIDPMPCWVWRPEGVRGLRVRPTAFNGPSTVPSWAYDPPERKRVCLTLGLSQRATGTAASDTAELLDAMADLDAEVIATLDPAQLGESATVPGNVRLVDFVPLNALLPSCAAIVHHGGTGTFASAYEHAVPQLVVPRIFWSVKWWGPVAQALGLERRGAGAYVADADQLTAVALHDRLAQVLNDESYARNAASLRDELEATPTPRDLARTLEKLIPEGVAR